MDVFEQWGLLVVHDYVPVESWGCGKDCKNRRVYMGVQQDVASKTWQAWPGRPTRETSNWRLGLREFKRKDCSPYTIRVYLVDILETTLSSGTILMKEDLHYRRRIEWVWRRPNSVWGRRVASIMGQGVLSVQCFLQELLANDCASCLACIPRLLSCRNDWGLEETGEWVWRKSSCPELSGATCCAGQYCLSNI